MHCFPFTCSLSYFAVALRPHLKFGIKCTCPHLLKGFGYRLPKFWARSVVTLIFYTCLTFEFWSWPTLRAAQSVLVLIFLNALQMLHIPSFYNKVVIIGPIWQDTHQPSFLVWTVYFYCLFWFVDIVIFTQPHHIFLQCDFFWKVNFFLILFWEISGDVWKIVIFCSF